MKSSRTKPSSLPSSSTQPSTTRNANPLSSSTASSNLSSSLRSAALSTTFSRSRLNLGSTTGLGRRSPLLNAKPKRTLPNSAVSGKVDHAKPMKKHFLSKSNDSLSGASSAVAKKTKASAPIPTAVPSRGIRHPAVSIKQKDKGTTLVEEKGSENSPRTFQTTNAEAVAQEIRRSVSSNCLDMTASAATASSDNQQRLSPTNVNCLGETMPTISVLNSNFALAPSRPGITLTATGTQTDLSFCEKGDARNSIISCGKFVDGCRLKMSHDSINTDFENLLEENLLVSRQISELCKVESATGIDESNSDADMMDRDSLGKPVEWDSQSNASLCSEPSLACLQDRIQQMEETHHSTAEELQATLQELADMGDLAAAYKKENEDLAQEKNMLQDALCTMTEKVHVYQSQAESLKKLLYRQAVGDENCSPDGMEGVNEKEKTLVELIKSIQEEKEEMHHQVESALEQNNKFAQEVEDAHSKIQTLDNYCDQVEQQKQEAEVQLAKTRESIKKNELDIARLTALLDAEKSRVVELQMMTKAPAAKTDMEELLSTVRSEKERADAQLADANSRILSLECDIQGLKEAVRVADEQRSTAEKSFNDTVHDYEHQLCARDNDLKALSDELNQARKEHDVIELNLRNLELSRAEAVEQFQNIQNLFSQEQRDWSHFQDDLLTAVRVANDFRTECELKAKTVMEENQQLRRKIDDLSNELKRLKTAKSSTPASPLKSTDQGHEIRSRIDLISQLRSPSDKDPTIATKPLRTPPNQSVSVKSLVQNMESNLIGSAARSIPRFAVVAKAVGIRKRDENIARSESNSSLDSTDKVLDFDKNLDDEPSMPGDGLKPIISSKRNSIVAEGKSDFKADPLSSLVKGKGSKRNALLKFCQEKTLGYSGIDITNFSSSWNDGLAFCALLHSYLPDRIPYKELDSKDKRRNFSLAFGAAKSVGIPQKLDISDLLSDDRPDWRAVMDYVISIYKHFETCSM
ncbi:cytospin-A-like [Paramacrobiotus metropolitanus]|uniref:cytospin-A-like n=1 Tax=Paramacrobiotus metropolitanus TaxID=2943436 RepID=UPI002445FCB3|nr:cytospin-A-like [Paramacrobiotus metropolitanus]XP_055328425.1 cytospin-A-like [Paramacrobiotus metropolitanus]XP_055328426.1 cytospin-A-like [Paramacrobiotus metropolitanus]XP_055328427.1 cytospin-A-like [Paramacrobiotus metropolitanus]XP_055328428.1 cytospin-A-like [Paramacrobiotus metropolitanus]XP_055328429.1 cytospin-A-like [Paramacrobiotus metropolitanus]XP_055328430.1 cytospin-A-like [Paramacrobiotus metropolitanus]XP_055328431.1 cytospin-A-like [Paramacrobiotus metropolitanus]XP_